MTGRSEPAMTVFVTPGVIAIVTPDLIGRLSLPAGKKLPVGAGNDAGEPGRQ